MQADLKRDSEGSLEAKHPVIPIRYEARITTAQKKPFQLSNGQTMKKTFALTNPRIQYARQIEGAKSDVRKYLKREREKKLPDGVDFWDFDCK